VSARAGAAALVLALASGPAAGVEALVLRVGRLEGPGWSAEAVELTLSLPEAGAPALRLTTGALDLPAGQLPGASLTCAELRATAGRIECPEGRLRVEAPWLDDPEVTVRLAAQADLSRVEAESRGARVAGGQVDLQGERDGQAWRVEAKGQGIDLARLRGALAPLLPVPAQITLAGTADLRLEAADGGQGPTLALEGQVRGLAAADGTGLHETQGLAGRVSADATRSGEDWRGGLEVRLAAGQAYLDPWFLDFGARPASAIARGIWAPAGHRLTLERLVYRDGEAATLEGSAELGPEGLAAARLTLAPARLDPLYRTYLQPLVQGTFLDRLTTTGRVSGDLAWTRARGLERVRVDPDGVTLGDEGGRFGLEGVSGTVRWGAQRGEPSTLALAGGHLYRVPFGAAELAAEAHGGALRLIRPVRLPVLDGGLQADSLELDGLGGPDWTGRLDAVLTPVSMEALTAALGWPAMGGQLSWAIPGMRYASGQARVGGALLVRVFDGEVVVRDLVIEDLLGPVPQVAANVDVRGLSLEPLTRAFSFGHMEGRLDGQVLGLQVQDWQPLAFDARLHTPPGDTSRHRISQRAVESLASLGGASGALSRTFLGLFKEFSYDRLGIACRLRRGVCEMDGVAPAEGGAYYIVKGGGLPRIDVLGFNREVDWATLVERLRQATQAGPPVVR
jgi:hypothetical protein